jgi:DNA replication and repair protein RecF
MHLSKLQLINFKNYEEAEIDLSSTINCFTGQNGTGKTNLLDAVYYLSMCKSYLNAVDKQNIRFEQPFFVIQGDFKIEEKLVKIHCSVKQGLKKVFKRNKKEYDKLAEHIGQFPSVMISPYDRNLITEGSEFRRKWMDGIISQSNKHYLEDLQRYSKVLDQRNALLKNMFEHGLFDKESIEVWDAQMIQYGERIFKARSQFIEEFIPVFQEIYSFIGETEEQISLEYKSQLLGTNFGELLEKHQRKDAHSHYSNAGTHKDDLVFSIKNHPVKKFGSQGQQKSYLIALRLAQYEWLKRHLQLKPILLLDDIFDKLDESRVQKLLKLVSESNFGQVMVTDTSQERLKDVFKNIEVDIRYFVVRDNSVHKNSINSGLE